MWYLHASEECMGSTAALPGDIGFGGSSPTLDVFLESCDVLAVKTWVSPSGGCAFRLARLIRPTASAGYASSERKDRDAKDSCLLYMQETNTYRYEAFRNQNRTSSFPRPSSVPEAYQHSSSSCRFRSPPLSLLRLHCDNPSTRPTVYPSVRQ